MNGDLLDQRSGRARLMALGEQGFELVWFAMLKTHGGPPVAAFLAHRAHQELPRLHPQELHPVERPCFPLYLEAYKAAVHDLVTADPAGGSDFLTSAEMARQRRSA